MPTTSEQLSEIYSPEKCMRKLSAIKTPIKALNSNTPTLSVLVRNMGVKSIEAYIKLWLLDLDASLLLKHRLKPVQIDQIAFRVVSEYRNLNLADINLIFTNAKFGEFGEFYDRVTIPMVMKWFKNYFNQRCQVAANQSYQNHVQNKTFLSGVSRSSESSLREEIGKANKFYKDHKAMQETKKRIEKVQKDFNKKSSV